jgi:glucose-1-phosphate adenylyltransferase
VPRVEARAFGVAEVANGCVVGFHEKPAEPPELPGRPSLALASMGIYLFDRCSLAGYLADHPDQHDFGHEVLPGMLAAGYRIAAYDFAGARGRRYWRDIADVDAYHGALMDLVCGEEGRTWCGPRVSNQGFVERSVLGADVRIAPGAEVIESVLLDGVTVGPGARLRRVVVDEGVRIDAGMSHGWAGAAGRGVAVVAAGAPVTIG